MSWMKMLYGAVTFFIFLLLILYFLHPITNLVGDLAYYLKIGEIIFKTGTIPAINLFSYTNSTFPFINPNWLSEVVFYLIYQSFGFNGLITFSIITIIAAFSLLFSYATQKIDYFATLVISLLSIHVIYERTEVKPELLSYLLLAIFITLLYRYKEKFTNWIFVLIPITLLWVNTHIYFFVGITVLLLFVIDALITRKDNLTSKKSITLFSVLAAVGLTTIFNPHFLQGAFYPFNVLNNYAFPVEENSNFFNAISYYSDTTFPFFGIMVTALWISILFSIKKLQPIDILLALFFTFLGFFAVRAFPLFAIGTFIPAVKALSVILHEMYKKISKEKLPLLQSGTLFVICLLLFPTIKSNLEIHGLGFGVSDTVQSAIDFLKKNNIKGPLYNNYDIGNYLVYRFYPGEQVFVDGRPEAYPKEFFERTYFPMQESETVFRTVADKYKFNVLLIKHTDTSPTNVLLMQHLIKDKEWKMVYLNNSVVIFLKNTSKNQQIIKDNLITENNVKLSPDDLTDKIKVGQLVNFFRSIDWEKPWLQMNLKYLEFEPNNCSALQNIAYIYQRQNNSNTPIYINKFMQMCSH